MHKLVIIYTHGMTTIEGTPINCLARFSETKSPELLGAYLYDERGVLVGHYVSESALVERYFGVRAERGERNELNLQETLRQSEGC